MSNTLEEIWVKRRVPVMTQATEGWGVTMPVFLGIWLVCAFIAGLIWENLVANTPPGDLSISFPAVIVLSLSFGLPGAGLLCFVVDIVRHP